MAFARSLAAKWLWGIGLAVCLLVQAETGSAQAAAPPDAAFADEALLERVAGEKLTPEQLALLAPAVAPFVAGEITVGVGPEFITVAGEQLFGLDVLDVFPMTEGASVAQDGVAATQTLLLETEPGRELAEIERLASQPGVVFALPNWTAQAAYGDFPPLVEDEVTIAQTEPPFLVTDSLYEQEQWYAQRIRAVRAWGVAEMLRGGSLGNLARVRVAVIDSGVDFNHAELADRLLPGWNYVSPGLTPQDDFGHGTHMTGLIAAAFNNGRGIAGIGPSVEILPYRALDQAGTGSMSNVANAIRAAANSNARIINLSLFLNDPHPLLEDAVLYAHSRGALVIASAGNCVLGQPCPIPVRFPAAYPEVLAVGGVTQQDIRAFYSAIGPELDLVAPGGDAAARILSLWPGDQSLRCGAQSFRLEGNDAYCYATGTSSAAAIVSGSAGLLLGVRPDLSGEQVRMILLESVHVLPFPEAEVGVGRLDLAAAMRHLVPADLTVAPDEISHTDYAPLRQVTLVAAETGEAQSAYSQTLAPLLPPKPMTYTLTVSNPSYAPMVWQATLQGGGSWARLVGPTSGLAQFEAPGTLTLVITPPTEGAGRLQATLRLDGSRADGGGTVRFIPVRLDMVPRHAGLVMLPGVNRHSATPAAPAVPFRWEEPARGMARTIHGLTDNSVATVGLPFAFTFKGRTFTDFRLASDGYISFPSGETGPGSANRCLDNFIRPSHLIAGWWTNLNPGVGQARISTFVNAQGEFVVEYYRVSLAGVPSQRVSMQIVLAASGEIGLNYMEAPTADEMASRHMGVTAGVVAQYGRFYRQLHCSYDQIQTGQMPQGGESFRFGAGDVY